MAVDLQQIQRLARQVQDGMLKREDFQAQVAALKGQALAAGRQAVQQRTTAARPAQVRHTGAPIVESGPDIRAGARTFSLTLALLALAVIAFAAVSAARGDAPRLTLPTFDLPRIAIPDSSSDRRRDAERSAAQDEAPKPPDAAATFDPVRAREESLRAAEAVPMGERPQGGPPPKPEAAKP